MAYAFLVLSVLPISAFSFQSHSNSSLLPKYIDEYSIPTPQSGPLAITVDLHGVVWFTESNASKLSRFDPTTGTFREYPVPGAGDMWGITVDGQGYVWCTLAAGKGSVNPGGQFTPGGPGRLLRFNPTDSTFSFVDLPLGSFPMRIITDRQGQVWFTEFLGNRIGVFNQLTHQLWEYTVPSNASGPADLTFDQQGTLWFTEAYGRKLAKFYPENHTFVEYSFEPPYIVPHVLEEFVPVLSPVGLGVSRDGHVWFADHGGNWIGEFQPKIQNLVRYPTHTPPKDVYVSSIPNGLLVDVEGRVWFTEHLGNSIAFFDPATRTMIEYSIPTGPVSGALWLAIAPDQNVWFAEWNTNKLGILHSATRVPFSLSSQQKTLRLQESAQFSFPISIESSQKISNDLILRSSWSSFNPTKDIAVKFDPEEVTTGSADTLAQVQVKLSDTVNSGNYTLGLGIDAGIVRVWSMIEVQVVASSHPEAPNHFNDYVVSTVIIAGAVLFLIVIMNRRRRKVRRSESRHNRFSR